MSAATCGAFSEHFPGYRFAHPGYGSRTARRHCERSEAIQNLSAETVWIASSQGLLAMTRGRQLRTIR